MSFSETEEDHLINLIINYPALYDISRNEYKNNVAKDTTWKKIGQQLNKSSKDCKKQWKIIRDSYARFKKSNKLGTGSGAALKNTKQKRYKQLKFLDSIPQRRSGDSNIRSPSAEHMTESSSRGRLSSNEPEGNIEDSEPGSNGEWMEWIDMENKEIDCEAASTKNNQVENAKKRSNEDTLVKLLEQRDAKRQSLIQTILAAKKEDDIDLFCRHMAEVLRNLPPLDKAKAKKHLSDVISEYEILAASRSNDSGK